VWQSRRRDNPDIYILTFRGQEILLPVLWLTRGKPLIFDEFIVPLAWTQEKNRRKTAGTFGKKLLVAAAAPLYKRWLRRCRYILADTDIHAQVSSQVSGVPLERYLAVPVGTDETVFRLPKATTKKNDTFTVFYYGNMLPLHGLPYVLQAAEQLAGKPIEFLLVGGGKATERLVMAAKARGAHVTYKSWIPFQELPQTVHTAHICLGGPFGNTEQAQRVITGKTYQFLASGVPTLIGESQASQTGKLFIDQENSLVVPQADGAALAQKIAWAYEHQDKLPAIGAAGRKLYEERFSVPVIARLLERLLSEVA
jgi:glycosyltransferase involved in cell wall biosynthesis